MNKLLATLIMMSMMPVYAIANTANQGVEISKSGAIVIKSQRQQKNDNTSQSIKIDKSGGIFVIIQRNINKYKCEDIKNLIEGTK